MTIDEAIKLIQVDIDDENVEWDSPLGRAYKLGFEALKRHRNDRDDGTIDFDDFLPGETKD